MAVDIGALAGGVAVLGLAAWAVHRTVRRRSPVEPAVDLSVLLDQVPVPESAAEGLVRAWAAGQHCVSCGAALVVGRHASHVALLDPSGITREWVDIGADRLTVALATSLPVCRNCHVSALFRRTYPELVTDRGDWTPRADRRE